jgi:hypothetical protein
VDGGGYLEHCCCHRHPAPTALSLYLSLSFFIKEWDSLIPWGGDKQLTQAEPSPVEEISFTWSGATVDAAPLDGDEEE